MIWDGVREAAGVVVALAAVSLLAWGAVWLMKRLQLQGAAASGATGGLRFVRALPLGPRERLVEVEWRGEILLLGVTAGGVSLVRRETPASELPPPQGATGEP